MTSRVRSSDKPVPRRVAEALDAAGDFLTIDQICQAVFGLVGSRERNTIAVALHRMGDEVEKRPAGFRRRRASRTTR